MPDARWVELDLKIMEVQRLLAEIRQMVAEDEELRQQMRIWREQQKPAPNAVQS